MADLNALFQSADWKKEKHIPVLDMPASVKKGECCKITATVGKEISHPNKTEHHIRWIELYFHPEGEKFPYMIGRFEFAAHGASVNGPDTSTVYTCPDVTACLSTDKPGKVLAFSYCNIHGLWQNETELAVE